MNKPSLVKSPRLAISPSPYNSSLSAIYNPSDEQAIAAGETFELRVTVTNQGFNSAVINVYVDETCQPLWTWCQFSTKNLALDTQQSSEILFKIPIPLAAPPGIYSYLIVVDAPEHYPEENPLQHQGKLQILPPIQSVVKVNDPTFQLIPATSSTEPIVIQAGAIIELNVIVFNRSNRVDRFRLTCIDLPRGWWTVVYPQGIEELGLAIAKDSLALNPVAQGNILLKIHPPATVNAGQFTSSIQLKSVNAPDLVLLDIFYFQIAQIHLLDLSLETVVGKVRRSPGKFKIALQNPGNTVREVSFSVTEEQAKNRCEYTLSQTQIKLAPRTSTNLDLEVKPKRYWRRPWIGKGASINFQVDCQDVYQLPLAKSRLLGVLQWEARPWWHLILVILSSCGAIAGLIFVIWWLFFRPLKAPEINNFASESSVYQAAEADFVRLNWQILRPQQIKSLSLVGRSPNSKIKSQAITYDLSEGLPEELAEFCTIKRLLNCRNVRTDARQAGEYVFELTVSPRKPGQKPSSLSTDAITIQPLPSPKITQFEANLDQKNNSANNSQDDNTVYLDFRVNNHEQLTAIKLTGFDSSGAVNYPAQEYEVNRGIVTQLKSYCQTTNQTLNCRRVPLSLEQNGSYIFELIALQSDARGQVSASDSQKSHLIKIDQPEQPQAANLMATQPIYQERANNPILLNWDIINLEELAAIKLVGRSPEGIVNIPVVTYNFHQGIPSQLQDYCQIINGLRCRNFPTSARQAGDYIFELMVITKQNPQLVSSAIKSDRIRIESIPLPPPPPVPLEILSFQIDGVDAPPKYIARINPQESPRNLTISWSVLSASGATIELLPVPGKVQPSGKLSYPLSNRSQTETLTLRVTDPSGKQVERSLIIETVVIEKTKNETRPSEKSIPESDRSTGILTPIDLPPEFK